VPDTLPAMAERTAFVTGGSGFIGGRLIRRLTAGGWGVRALARSDRSAAAVEEGGAEAVRGDLDQVESMRAGAEGCDVAFHAAAYVGEWGTREDFERGNVIGTQNALEACRSAGVRRFVHVGTEAALAAGQPLVRIDETAPLRPDSKAPYPATKAKAEQAVRAANGGGFETVVVRPRFVWGPGDTTLLPGIVETVKAGRFAWIGGGEQLTSTAYIDNVVEGLVLGAERGRSGEAYFITDGEPVQFRNFLTRMLETQGVDAPSRTLPLPLARAFAWGSEAVWKGLRRDGEPPVTRAAVWLSAVEITIDISKAREELGYEPRVSIDEGLKRLAAA
jgi:nucleoside-diphosphate-sugar epimerase